MDAGKAADRMLVFLDMGTMLCQGSADEAASCHSLTQLLVPGLEQRAWHLPPLSGTPTGPGLTQPLCRHDRLSAMQMHETQQNGMDNTVHAGAELAASACRHTLTLS